MYETYVFCNGVFQFSSEQCRISKSLMTSSYISQFICEGLGAKVIYFWTMWEKVHTHVCETEITFCFVNFEHVIFFHNTIVFENCLELI